MINSEKSERGELPPEILKRNQASVNLDRDNIKTVPKPETVSKTAGKWLNDIENSPMDSHEEQGRLTMKEEHASEAVKLLMDEHKAVLKVIGEFEKGIVAYKMNGYKLTDEINASFSKFFKCLDEDLLPHNRKEEKTLFPVLNKKLILAGEHSKGKNPLTAIDVMEDDHIKFIQLGALSFNLLGLSTRLADPRSRLFVLDTAYDTSRELIELLKLHIYREDETLFPLAQKYLSKEELNAVYEEMEKL